MKKKKKKIYPAYFSKGEPFQVKVMGIKNGLINPLKYMIRY
jgi:hypothetical protein